MRPWSPPVVRNTRCGPRQWVCFVEELRLRPVQDNTGTGVHDAVQSRPELIHFGQGENLGFIQRGIDAAAQWLITQVHGPLFWAMPFNYDAQRIRYQTQEPVNGTQRCMYNLGARTHPLCYGFQLCKYNSCCTVKVNQTQSQKSDMGEPGI